LPGEFNVTVGATAKDMWGTRKNMVRQIRIEWKHLIDVITLQRFINIFFELRDLRPGWSAPILHFGF
jgi:hypothetical protein